LAQVGVEHLLRDINDPSVSTMANEIKHKVESLTALHGKLLEVKGYLTNVLNGRLPVNNQVRMPLTFEFFERLTHVQIVYNLQNIFNLLPNLNVDELIR
jgi:26S proteasome regulatory subunit N8